MAQSIQCGTHLRADLKKWLTDSSSADHQHGVAVGVVVFVVGDLRHQDQRGLDAFEFFVAPFGRRPCLS
jgi:hypothetical protein